MEFHGKTDVRPGEILAAMLASPVTAESLRVALRLNHVGSASGIRADCTRSAGQRTTDWISLTVTS